MFTSLWLTHPYGEPVAIPIWNPPDGGGGGSGITRGAVVGGTVVGGVVVGDVLVDGGGGGAAAETVNVVVSVLSESLDSRMRLTSSTQAFTVCVPAVAVHVAATCPPLAVRFTDAPPASEVLSVSLHVTGVLPSTMNCTPMIVPDGVAAPPWFLTVALNRTGVPGATAGLTTLVTTRSGIVLLTAATDSVCTSGCAGEHAAAAIANTAIRPTSVSLVLREPIGRLARDGQVVMLSLRVRSSTRLRVSPRS